MAVPVKYRRLLEATQKFNSFNLFIDFVALVLFIISSIAAANKLLPRPLIETEYFNLSWRTIGICSLIFLILLMTQLQQEIRRRRELTAFEKEATLKAARRHRNFRSRY